MTTSTTRRVEKLEHAAGIGVGKRPEDMTPAERERHVRIILAPLAGETVSSADQAWRAANPVLVPERPPMTDTERLAMAKRIVTVAYRHSGPDVR